MRGVIQPSGRSWLATVVACVLASACGTSAGGEAATVFYQVTGTDGQIRQADQVPTTRQNIREVLRVTRFERAPAGSVILSTGPHTVIEVNPGKTVTHRMTWDGKAWVVAAKSTRTQAAPPRVKPPEPAKAKEPDKILAEEIRRTETVLNALRARLKNLDHAAAEAERKLRKVKGTPGEKAAAEVLAAVRARRDDCVRAVEQYRAVLSALGGGVGSPPSRRGKASGKVEALPPKGAASKPTGGVREPLRGGKVLRHRVQVWKLPPAGGRRTYRIWMAHPEAGRLGAFYYVAYADTDRDGRPDKQIARSPLASAAQPGQWTQWQFTTSERGVFVGNAWTDPWTQVYWQAGTGPGGSRHGLGHEVWVAPFWGAGFRKGDGWGFLTNLRYRVAIPAQTLDEPPSPSTGSGTYEWQIK